MPRRAAPRRAGALCDEGCTLELEKSVIFQIVMLLLIDISARLGYELPVASSEDFLEMLHIFGLGGQECN